VSSAVPETRELAELWAPVGQSCQLANCDGLGWDAWYGQSKQVKGKEWCNCLKELTLLAVLIYFSPFFPILTTPEIAGHVHSAST
jgi:hypothetical protein